jgi:hypothetical protein
LSAVCHNLTQHICCCYPPRPPRPSSSFISLTTFWHVPIPFYLNWLKKGKAIPVTGRGGP